MIDELTIEIIYQDNVLVDLEELKRSYVEVNKVIQNRRLKKLIIAGRNLHFSKAARDYGHQQGRVLKDLIIAEAMVVHSLPQKMIVNIYLSIVKEYYPVRCFSDVNKAREWLAGFSD
jgi:hypothetical protein